MTISAALSRAAEKLKNASSSSWLDSEAILCYLLACKRSWLLAHTETKLSFWQLWQYRELIKKRNKGIPLAYIVGNKEFYGRIFKVNHHTLIPRPDTELMVDIAIEIIHTNNSIKTIVDIGTGSGCLAITLALTEPKIKVIATDISPAAIKLAQKNSIQYKLNGHIKFFQGNLLTPIIKKLPSALSNNLVIANLPYLRKNEIDDNLLFEPVSALDGGSDGLKYYRELIKQIADLPSAARPKILLIELHPPTHEQVLKLLKTELINSSIEIKTDLANLPRVAVIQL